MSAFHEFHLGEEEGEGDVYVVARCSCGWSGAPHPASELGQTEARDEYDDHVSGREVDVTNPLDA